MKRLLVVYHSMTGGTRQMVEAACAGASQAEDLELVCKTAQAAGPEDLRAADGYLFATPENLAAIAGLMKDFFDRCYYPVLGELNGRPYAAMVCAGSDGRQAAAQLARIATGWRLKPIAEPLIVCTHAQTPEAIVAPKQVGTEDRLRCEELGSTLANGLALGLW